jgi:hypothetical protein
MVSPARIPSRRLRVWINLLLLGVALIACGSLLLRPEPAGVPTRPTARHGLLLAGKPRESHSLLRGGLALVSAWDLARTPVVAQLDFPLGSEAGALTYNARPFREVDHLADDLNGIGGQNSDLGDPVYAAGDGLVIFAGEAGGGWGKVVMLQHREENGDFFQTFYGHLNEFTVRPGELVPRGATLGTVGTANGQYFAHLHFEIRRGFHLDLGSGYSPFPLNRLNPEETLRKLARPDPAKLHPSPGLAEQPDPGRPGEK